MSCTRVRCAATSKDSATTTIIPARMSTVPGMRVSLEAETHAPGEKRRCHHAHDDEGSVETAREQPCVE